MGPSSSYSSLSLCDTCDRRERERNRTSPTTCIIIVVPDRSFARSCGRRNIRHKDIEMYISSLGTVGFVPSNVSVIRTSGVSNETKHTVDYSYPNQKKKKKRSIPE